VKIVKSLGMLVGLLVASTGSKCAPPKEPAPSESSQHFVCNTGYTLEKCHKDVAVLRKTLEKYPVEQLGEWTWVLVRSVDWKEIKVTRGMDPNSPAFTYYSQRETFLEEALVAEVGLRRIDLLLVWGMSIEKLLDYAVSHELGHALCNERNEAGAERVARLLRKGNHTPCRVDLQANRRREEDATQDGWANAPIGELNCPKTTRPVRRRNQDLSGSGCYDEPYWSSRLRAADMNSLGCGPYFLRSKKL
jgi:hypothetical protein